MKTKLLCIILVLLILFCQIVFGQSRDWVNVPVKQNNGQKQDEVLYRNSYALLIGNSFYSEWNSLPGVERDVPQIEAVLRDQHGFVVEKALNLSKNELRSRIDQFISRYGQDYENRLLIYYAGHGYTAVLPDKRVMGYLVMKDAPVVPPVEEALIKTPKNLGEFRLNAVSMDEIENLAKEISTRHAFFVFDSCFSGTALYRDNVINVPKEISSEELEQMRGFLTAGNEKQRVRDDSPFRRAFIKGLEGKADTNGDGYILSSELGAFVKREVYLETRNTDTPQSPIFGKQTNFTRGDMVFIMPKKDSMSPAQIAWNNFRGTAKDIIKYDFVDSLTEDLAYVSSNFKFGFIDKKGKVVVPIKYDVGDGLGSFSEGLAAVWLNRKAGFIDKSGKEVIPLKYDYVWSFSEGLAAAQLNGKWRLIDKTGKDITLLRYEHVNGGFSEGFLAVSLNEKWGYINKTGKEVVSLKYSWGGDFSEGLAAVQLNYKIGFVDKTGKEVVPIKYVNASSFLEGLAAVSLNNKWGFINKTGKEVIPLKYDDVFSYSESFAGVALNGKYGFIDKSGKEVIPLKYDYVRSFSEGSAPVVLDGKWGLIDKSGRELIPLKYDWIWLETFKKEGFIGVKLNGKKGFVDFYGNEYFDF